METRSKGLLSLVSATGLLFAFQFILVSAFLVQIDWGQGEDLLDKHLYFYRFYADFFLAIAAAVLFFGASSYLRLISALIVAVFLTAIFIQYQSYSITGRFLPSIALENMQHAEFVDLDDIQLNGVIWCILFFTACWGVQKIARNHIRFITRVCYSVFLLLIATVTKNDKHILDEEFLNQRFEFFNSGKPGIPPVSPISELIDTYQEYREYLRHENWMEARTAVMSESAAEFAFKHYSFLGEIDSDFPLFHNTRFDYQLPFEGLLQKKDNLDSNQKKNVIIFFAEGISSRIIPPYSDLLPGIAPNIAAFSETSNIRVDNYYNHTYATYRALGGQLCSTWPNGRLRSDVKYHCLPHILRNRGYTTHFLHSQPEEKTDLSDVLGRAGFDHIDSASSLRKLLAKPLGENNQLSKKRGSTTDRKLMLGLIERLKGMEASKSPFFIGIYNLETHTGMRLFEDDTVYHRPHGDESYVLNTFHNFDKTFGQFWEYFKNSPFYENTIVVLTADHATFPSRDFLDLSLGAPVRFVDKIPLLIYHPDLQSNFVYDAQRRTSIDFAPTILNILGVQNQDTAFVGDSLFSTNKPVAPPAAGTGRVLWYLFRENNMWVRITPSSDKSKAYLQPARDQLEFVGYLMELERQNKLVP